MTKLSMLTSFVLWISGSALFTASGPLVSAQQDVLAIRTVLISVTDSEGDACRRAGTG